VDRLRKKIYSRYVSKSLHYLNMQVYTYILARPMRN
jgi:hypothetical protein